MTMKVMIWWCDNQWNATTTTYRITLIEFYLLHNILLFNMFLILSYVLPTTYPQSPWSSMETYYYLCLLCYVFLCSEENSNEASILNCNFAHGSMREIATQTKLHVVWSNESKFYEENLKLAEFAEKHRKLRFS